MEFLKRISCGALLDAGLKGFELFELFTEGSLQPYHPENCFKIINLDNLEQRPEKTLDELMKYHERLDRLRKSGQIASQASMGGVFRIIEPFKPLSKEEIKKTAEEEYKKQTFHPIIPEGCLAFTFTLDADPTKAAAQVQEARRWELLSGDVMKVEQLWDLLKEEAGIEKIEHSEKPETNHDNSANNMSLAPVPTDKGTQWNNIKITFMDEEEILIQIPREKTHFTRRYDKAGFEDGRDHSPKKSWELLFDSARSGDSVIPFNTITRKTIERRVQELNKGFLLLFPDLSDKPFVIDTTNNQYTLLFQLEPTVIDKQYEVSASGKDKDIEDIFSDFTSPISYTTPKKNR